MRCWSRGGSASRVMWEILPIYFSKLIMELIIYSFFLFNFIPVIHTEIFVYGVSISYGRNGLSVSPVRKRTDMTFLRKIFLGKTNLPAAEFFGLLRGISMVYKFKKYDLFHANCRHFSTLLINELKPDRAGEGTCLIFYRWLTSSFRCEIFGTM